jgi:hypothetical protein
MGGLRCATTRGLVDGKYEPTIDGVPISGPTKGGAAPWLDLEPGTANADGQSWVVIEATPNEQGRLDDKSNVIIAHRNQNLSADDKLARFPVAMILRQGKQPSACVQNLFFNVQYQRVTLPTGEGPARHIFF